MASIKTSSNTGKQDVPNVLWIGVRDGDPGPIMLAREKPEAFKLKFRAWMFPHNFVVKEIEFWSGYNWGTIKLETSQARNVLLEHAKYHPFKPFTDGEPWEIRKFQKTIHESQMSISSTESLMGDISKSILETNRPSKATPTKKQPLKQQNETTKPIQQQSTGVKNIQILKQKQEEAAIIKAMKSSSMSPKPNVSTIGSAKKNKVIDNIKKSTTSSNNDTKDNRTSSPVQSQKHQSESPKSKTPELHFNYKKPRQYPMKDTKHSHKDESVGRRSRERQRRQSEGVEKKEGNNEVISDKRLQHQLKFTNGSPDVVNEMFKEIRSATASPSDSNRSQLPNKVSNETAHPKQRLGKHSMGYTIGTYPGEMKKSLPRSSSPVLTAHQGASSRVLKGHPENLPALPDIPAVQAKLAKTCSVQQSIASKEDSGILNIENDAPKSMTTKQHFLPRKVEQQIVLDRCANAFMATDCQASSTSKEKENKIPTPPSSPINRPPKGLNIADIPTPPNMTREKFETAVTNLKRFFVWSSIRNNISTPEEKQQEAENRYQDLLRQLKNSDGAERQMLLKHNLTVASDVMSACSSDEYSTPVEKEQDEKAIKEDIIEQEDPPCKAQPRVGPVQSVGQTNQILAMSTSNEQAYREMLLLLQGESKITDELAPIDGDADEIPDGRVTADSLCSSALLLLADPDQDSLYDSERPTVISRGFPTISQGETPVSAMGHIAQELIEQLSSEELKAQLDQQHDLVKKLSFLKLQQTAETVANMQKGIAAMKPKPSQQAVISNPDVNHELEEKIANITKLVQAELEEEKRRKRNQGVLVEEHGESLDVDDTKILVPVSLQNLLNSSRWVKKDGIDTSETLQTKILKGMKPPKNMDRWKGMESWLRIHYFDHLDTSSKSQEEENNQKEEEHSSLLHARFVVCILNGAGATPVGLEADLEVYVGRANGKNDGRRGLDKFSRELAEQIEKYLSHPHENSNIMDGTSKPSAGKGDNKMDQKASNDLAQTLSLFLEVPNLRDCVSISTVVHATISYLFSRHFPAFSVPRPILKALRTVPYISHKTGSVYQCVGIVTGYVNSVDIEEFFKDSETKNNCAEDYLRLEDKIGIISSPRGRVLFGPANIWNKDIRKISESGEEANINEASDSNEASKPALTLPKILEIGQVVLFDAICVIDTAASAVSKPNVIGKDARSKEQEKCSQINTNIAVKKMIYMIATKVTKMDDSKLGGMGGIDKSGSVKYSEKSYHEMYTPTLILEGCDDSSSERSICVGGGQIETTFENTYKTELRQRCTNIVMSQGPELYRPNISSVVHSNSSSDGFWIPSDSLTFSKDLNNEKVENSESCPNKFDIMDLPIDEEINGTYAQTIVVEPYKIITIKDLETNSSSESTFISLFKMELLLAASAASDELMDSEDELSYKRRIGPSTVLQDKEAIYFANHYAAVWARLGYKCAELFQDYLTLCSLGSQGCVLFHWSNLLSRFRFPRCLHRSVLINVTAKIFERQMDTGTSQEEPCVSPKNVSLFTNSERFKYSLDNPLTLKSLSNIRAILDQHTNFLMGLAATSSLSLKSDLSHLSTIPTLFILQRLFIPLKIYHDLPEIPVVKGKYTTKPEAKKELAEKSMFEDQYVADEPQTDEGSKIHDVGLIPTASITKTPEKRYTQEVKKEDVLKSQEAVFYGTSLEKRHTQEVKKEDIIKSNEMSSQIATASTKPTRKAVAFYAEVDQEVEEIRRRLMAASPQPYTTTLVNGSSNEAHSGDNTGKEIRSPVKSTAHVKPLTSFREEVRIQHGTDVLTFETDAEGNVPVAKIDAVLSHVVALKYRLPQNKQSYSDLSNDGFGSRSSTPRPHSREGFYTETESITSDSSNICWRIVNKEGDVFRRPQEGWGTTRVYIPVTAAKAPIHSQTTIAPIPVRPFQQQPPHISFQDPFPLKASDHSLGTTSHVGRVGSALGMVNPCINSPTDCHSSQTSHSTHGVGLYSSTGNLTSNTAASSTSGSSLGHHQLQHHRINQPSVHFSKPY